MSITFSLIAPDNTEYPLETSGTGWQRLLEDIPAGALGYPPIEYQGVPLVSRDGIVIQGVRVRERVIDIPLAIIAEDVSRLLESIRPLYYATSLHIGAPRPCKLKATLETKTAFLDLYPSGEAWSELVERAAASRRVALRFLCPDPRWYGTGMVQMTLTRSTSVTTNYIAARLASAAGAAWSGLAGGMNNEVYALAIAPDGTLYAGGAFTTAGGVTANRVACWTGTGWAALGPGMNGPVYALAVAPDGTLYAGGNFTSPASHIARWTGSAWETLGTGTNGWVLALTVAPDGTLYVGGLFTTAGGVTVYNVARWTGSAWQALGTGTSGTVRELASTPDGRLYAGGLFTTAGGITVNNIAEWTGTAWRALGGGVDNWVYALAFAPDGMLYAGGLFITAGGVTVNRIARWTGSAWQALGGGTNDLVYKLAVAPSGILCAGGSFTVAGGNTLTDRIAFWNGSRWLSLDCDLPGTPYIHAFAFTKTGALYVGFSTAGSASSSVTHSISAPALTRPRLVFTGPLIPQYIRNETTGKQVWFNLNLLAGEVVTVDFDQLTVTSDWRGNLLGGVVPGSDFGEFALMRGENLVTFYATSTGSARLEHVSRWMTLVEALA